MYWFLLIIVEINKYVLLLYYEQDNVILENKAKQKSMFSDCFEARCLCCKLQSNCPLNCVLNFVHIYCFPINYVEPVGLKSKKSLRHSNPCSLWANLGASLWTHLDGGLEALFHRFPAFWLLLVAL